MRPLRFALLGCGFWSRYQLAAWQEVGGAQLVAVYNRTPARAEETAARAGGVRAYGDAAALLAQEELDFVDIVTAVEAHRPLVELAAARGVPAICQKPMAPSLADAEAMVACCRAAGVPLLIHENWRWQRPIRELAASLAAPELGRPFRARLTYANSFPVFQNQPFLRQLEQFILTDMGSHILDVARFLFGEFESLYCRTARVTPGIRGEDVATVVLAGVGGATVTCELSYASRLAEDRFPQTGALVECAAGSVELAPEYWIRVTTRQGTQARQCPPPHYCWADPAYDLVHASIVPCCADLLAGLRGERQAETSGDDNLRTLRLVFGAYESARTGAVVRV